MRESEARRNVEILDQIASGHNQILAKIHDWAFTGAMMNFTDHEIRDPEAIEAFDDGVVNDPEQERLRCVKFFPTLFYGSGTGYICILASPTICDMRPSSVESGGQVC
eukprot:Selendium_serpulae@DN1625_c0_g1_i2.p1